MGAYGLRRIQVGKETTKGTAVTAGKILELEGQIEDTSELQMRPADYNTGLLPGSNSGSPVFVSDLAECGFEGDFTCEVAPYILSAGWASAAPVTAATGSTWVFPAPTTAINTPATMTVQTGDNTEQQKATYGLIPEFSIKGATNDTAKTSGKFMLRSATAASTGFDSATNLAATTMPVNLFKIYSDPATGTVGTTQLVATVRDFDIKVKSKFHHKQFADGNLAPTSDGQGRPEVEIDLVLEYNSTAVAIRNQFESISQRRLRFQSAATVTANNTFYMDAAGYWSNPKKIAEKDGNTTVAITFKALPAGTTTADYVNFNVVTNVSAL
jgi:hypothetical protein